MGKIPRLVTMSQMVHFFISVTIHNFEFRILNSESVWRFTQVYDIVNESVYQVYSKFRIPNSKFRIQNSKFRIQNSEFRIQNCELSLK